MAIANLHFHESYRAFPPARLWPRLNSRLQNQCGLNEPSWFVRILPFIEQNQAFSKWDLYESTEFVDVELRTNYVATFYCPTRRSGKDQAVVTETIIENRLPCGCGGTPKKSQTGVGSDYAGNHGTLDAMGDGGDFYRGGNGSGVLISSRAACRSEGEDPWGRPLPPKPYSWIDKVKLEVIRDGTSNTILVGEAHIPYDQLQIPPFDGPIYTGRELTAICRVGGPGVPIARDMDAFDPSITYQWGSWHPSQCHFAMTDASTHSISNAIDTITLGRLCHRSDGETAEIEGF